MPEDRIPVEAYERVEIFRGPSAFLNGFVGAVGGTINLVPKRATNTAITSLAATYGTNGQVGGQADVGRRFGSDQQFGVRFNGTYRDGYTPLANNKERLRQYRALARLCRKQRAAGRELRIHQAG